MSKKLMAPLPPKVRDLLYLNTHPGLQLDKYICSWDEDLQPGKRSQEVQAPGIERVVQQSQQSPKGLNFDELLKRHRLLLEKLDCRCFEAETDGPMTIHLARASALENAGICLHHIYGFAYLPGTGIKGLARAYAETIWYPRQFARNEHGQPLTQKDTRLALEAWRTIETIFGWSPGSDSITHRTEKPWVPPQILKKRQQEKDKTPASTGTILFHDAWPLQWPRLERDILNCHHQEYYKNAKPPGDWENPIPVYFLTVSPKQKFLFAVSSRRTGCEELVAQASEWLAGAIYELGVGAKTNAGYGSFLSPPQAFVENQSPTSTPKLDHKKSLQNRAIHTSILELITPAFFAGSYQNSQDCILRPATLRGLLRWWWRTMHAGYLDVDSLQSLEGAIWGDTKNGSRIKIIIKPLQATQSVLFPANHVALNNKGEKVLKMDREFKRSNQLVDPPRKRTCGLLYLSYGMDEMPAGNPDKREQRCCMLPGATWEITITARDVKHRRKDNICVNISASQVSQQAIAALSLLCRFGGVGSKGRNGFGSMDGKDIISLEEALNISSSFRREMDLPCNAKSDNITSSLHNMLRSAEILTPWSNYWFALDQLGYSVQEYCQSDDKKRSWLKESLGLPRNIGISSKDGSSKHGYKSTFDKKLKRDVVWLGQSHQYLWGRNSKDMRHASPVHLHLRRDISGSLVVVATAFPCAVLPDEQTSQNELVSFLNHLEVDLPKRISQYPDCGNLKVTNKVATKEEVPLDVSIPVIQNQDIRDKVRELDGSEFGVFEITGVSSGDKNNARILRISSIKNGYQPEGKWTVKSIPPSISSGVCVVAEQEKNPKTAVFVEVFGRIVRVTQSNRKSGRRK